MADLSRHSPDFDDYGGISLDNNEAGSPIGPDRTDSPAAASRTTTPANGDGIASAPDTTGSPSGAPVAPAQSAETTDPKVLQQVQEVLASEIGIPTMLNRLKQSVTSAKEFALFLKKRSALEDDQARGLKKLCKVTQENVHHADHRQGSFARSYDEMLSIHERMAENGSQFALSLHQMHEDLLEIAAATEKHRKTWKQSGLEAENRLVSVETAMRKSKAKYDSLAEEYDRVRTGEAKQKTFGFKGPKSAAQQEEDLLRKTQAADSDYQAKVQAFLSEKATMEASTRPEAVRALQDLVKEIDAGTTLQMQKFASFNEKLLLSNGLVISPLKNAVLPGQQSRSLKDVIQAVDNKKDMETHITSQYSRVPAKGPEVKYERHPVLAPPPSVSQQALASVKQAQAAQAPPKLSDPMPPPPPGSMASRSGTGFDSISSPVQGPGSSLGPPMAGPNRSGSGPGPSHERSASHGGMLGQPNPQPAQQNVRNSAQFGGPPSRFNNAPGMSPVGGPPQLGALPFQGRQSPGQPTGPSPPPQYSAPNNAASLRSVSPGSSAAGAGPPMMPPPTSGRSRQVFGVPLTRLYERDGYAVPMVVHQCIQAVDCFGLTVEGIYRLSGSTSHVQKLKSLFDTDPDSQTLDFRNPEHFFHDVNGVAGLLKQFLRDLPDPLLTSEHYQGFVDAAKHDDETVRRDSLHALINELPDPNYATLRSLTLHLNRVTEQSATNRMNSQNLAIVFGPTLMGTAPGSNIADAGWQVRVVDTILQNTYQIFDED